MGEKKKVTNKKQFDALLDYMEKHEHVAKGMKYAENFINKEKYVKIWKEIAVRLNSLGPPTRTDLEWQKVWNDFKLHTKKKLQENKREINSTGGGPNKLHHFSAYEERAIQLLNLEKVSQTSGRVFGLPTPIAQRSSELSRPAASTAGDLGSSHRTAPLSEGPPEACNSDSAENDTVIEEHSYALAADDFAPTECRRGSEEQVPNTPSQDRTNCRQSGGRRYRKALLEKQTQLLENVNNSLKSIEKYSRRTFYLKEKKLKLLKAFKERREKREINKENIEMEILELKKHKLEMELRQV